MSPLRAALADYLAVRRALGYELARAEKLLGQFIAYLEARGAETVTVEHAVAWALMPGRGDAWHSLRLSVVRCFAAHLHGLDPSHEVPAREILHSRPPRATPYIYSPEQIASMIEVAGTFCPPHRAATHQTLIGLLAATGMRIGEALALEGPDIDLGAGVILVRKAKFGKSRELPLHHTTVEALTTYIERTDCPQEKLGTEAVFVTTRGSRLGYEHAYEAFQHLLAGAGIKPRSGSCRPRLHDLRHTFAVRTLLDAYREGVDPEARIAALSTYLGHVDPTKTYWYLSAAPELLGLAAERLGLHLGESS